MLFRVWFYIIFSALVVSVKRFGFVTVDWVFILNCLSEGHLLSTVADPFGLSAHFFATTLLMINKYIYIYIYVKATWLGLYLYILHEVCVTMVSMT